jgi:hypothetical protein
MWQNVLANEIEKSCEDETGIAGRIRYSLMKSSLFEFQPGDDATIAAALQRLIEAGETEETASRLLDALRARMAGGDVGIGRSDAR